MKSANEKHLTCADFQERINAYIDSELDDMQRQEFLRHVEECTECRETLHGCQHIKNMLGNMKPAELSTEFDFRLKGRIRMEAQFLEDPIYRMKLFMNDNLNRLVIVPAAAAVIMTAAIYGYGQYGGVPGAPDGYVQEPRVAYPVADAKPQSQEEIVSFVLESVKESDVETGLFLNDMAESDGSAEATRPDPEITLISF